MDILGCLERSDLIEKLKALYELKTEYELEVLHPLEGAEAAAVREELGSEYVGLL